MHDQEGYSNHHQHHLLVLSQIRLRGLMFFIGQNKLIYIRKWKKSAINANAIIEL